MTSSPIFMNKLEKTQNFYRQNKHRAQLQVIARKSHRYPSVDQAYRSMLHDNNKALYFKQQRDNQIQIENTVLLTKLQKVKAEQFGYKNGVKNKRTFSCWMKDRSHSLNEFVRNTNKKHIDYENQKILKGIMSQKPQFSVQQLNKSSIEQQKLSSSISKLQKYRLPQIHDLQFRQSKEKDKIMLTQRSMKPNSKPISEPEKDKDKDKEKEAEKQKPRNRYRQQQMKMGLDFKPKLQQSYGQANSVAKN